MQNVVSSLHFAALTILLCQLVCAQGPLVFRDQGCGVDQFLVTPTWEYRLRLRPSKRRPIQKPRYLADHFSLFLSIVSEWPQQRFSTPLTACQRCSQPAKSCWWFIWMKSARQTSKSIDKTTMIVPDALYEPEFQLSNSLEINIRLATLLFFCSRPYCSVFGRMQLWSLQ